MEKKEKKPSWEKMKMANVLGLIYLIISCYIIHQLFHVEIPNSNRDILNVCLVTWFGVGLGGVVYYFFGFRKNGKAEEAIEDGRCGTCGKTVGGTNDTGDPDGFA